MLMEFTLRDLADRNPAGDQSDGGRSGQTRVLPASARAGWGGRQSKIKLAGGMTATDL
jgi:hypothetical protein